METAPSSYTSPGRLIYLQRQASCLTQQQLADAVGVTQSAVAKWEADEATPALRHRRQLAAALNVPVGLLFSPEAAA